MKTTTSDKLYPYPNGWYVVCLSSELPPKKIITLTFMGEEIVVFRTESGIISALYAYCPHLGAHLGFGGAVKGENLECPFHHFQFDINGDCVKTGYDTPPPPGCKIPTWLLQEKNGLILIWHDAKKNEPDWEIPQIDWTGWSPLKSQNWKIKSHPQETSENSVDWGHFTIVHRYKEVKVLEQVKVDGSFLKARYAFQRDIGFLGWNAYKLNAEFSFAIMGLGYSFVEVEIPKYGLEVRNFVFARPTDSGNMNLCIALSLKDIRNPGKIHPILSLIPKKILKSIMLFAIFKGYKNDVRQDFFIWENKKFIPRPAIAKGDGPLGLYRRYVRKFYYPDLTESYNNKP